MFACLKYCGLAIKLSSTLLLVADAVSSSTPLSGLFVSLLTLIPCAWGFQEHFGTEFGPAAATEFSVPAAERA
jgi:hypothetical protein